MKIKPLNGNILVKPTDKRIEKKGSLFVVNNENAKNRAHEAQIVAVHEKSALSEGDTVFYSVHAVGTDIPIGNETLKMMREADLIAVEPKKQNKNK
ncbi:hypothetical protein KGQ29_04185, partial [Patescibacteria group bacterium]|nr:hypothetical protein [Patescibacteria group bacterium]